MPSQQVLEEKISEVEEIKQLLKGYKYIGIASLQKVRAAQLQELKKSLVGKVYMRVLKNTLTKLALDTMEKEDLKKLDDYLEGANLFLFTDLNPFKLALLLERGKVKRQHRTTTRTNNKPAKCRRITNQNRIRKCLGKQRYFSGQKRRTYQRTSSSTSVKTRNQSSRSRTLHESSPRRRFNHNRRPTKS